MEIQKTKIEKLKANPTNPRVIKDDKFHKLVNSILALPKMLEIRPIVVDAEMMVLGGNQRLRALEYIKGMEDAELMDRISGIRDIRKAGIVDEIKSFWIVWNGDVPYIDASSLTADEQRQFIVKDNSGFGEWDFDLLNAQFDIDELTDWGVDVRLDDELEINYRENNDISQKVESLYQITIDCDDETDQERIYNELKDNYRCRVLTL